MMYYYNIKPGPIQDNVSKECNTEIQMGSLDVDYMIKETNNNGKGNQQESNSNTSKSSNKNTTID